ncbi:MULTISPECIES: type II CAAX endopeptidase family protein [Anaerolinea]|uniref:type II CAAX endopeptidase family protein n=1 Tax=Anaerolinea TaxID=233189 RepID=UPI0026277BE1|nr:type II CAAX endopeptidase family protein [Anaerolinea thermophila]
MNNAKRPEFPLLFFLLTLGFSWLFWMPLAFQAQGWLALPQPLADFLASPLNPAPWAPTLMGFLITLIGAGWRGLGAWLKDGLNPRNPGRQGWSMAIFLPLVIFLGAHLIEALIRQHPPDLSILSNPPMALIAPFVILLTGGPLQEEFGWRGYALPRLLHRYNALTASLWLGFFWWLWHLPLVFIPGRFMVNSLPLFLLLLVEITLTATLMTWVYRRTRQSILAALVFHTLMNYSIWVLLPSMQVSAGLILITCALLALAVAGLVLREETQHIHQG